MPPGTQVYKPLSFTPLVRGSDNTKVRGRRGAVDLPHFNGDTKELGLCAGPLVEPLQHQPVFFLELADDLYNDIGVLARSINQEPA